METPTANIYPDAYKVLPPYGVYAVIVDVEGKRYKGICNLGVKPTIPGENEVGFEVWLFDFSGDLYDKELTAYFVSFLREERKFASLTQLKEQITRDTVWRSKYFLRKRANGIRNRFFTEVCKTEKKSWKIAARKILVISL